MFRIARLIDMARRQNAEKFVKFDQEVWIRSGTDPSHAFTTIAKTKVYDNPAPPAPFRDGGLTVPRVR
jgi:hypothetical protein